MVVKGGAVRAISGQFTDSDDRRCFESPTRAERQFSGGRDYFEAIFLIAKIRPGEVIDTSVIAKYNNPGAGVAPVFGQERTGFFNEIFGVVFTDY